jgi:hypothetical protein
VGQPGEGERTVGGMDMRRRELILSALIVIGLGSITYGAGLAWPPLWWIVGGVSVLVTAVLWFVEV